MLNLRRGSARLETQRSNIGFAADYVTFLEFVAHPLKPPLYE